MKNLKIIFGLIIFIVLNISCTDLSEDLTLYDDIKKETIIDTSKTNANVFDTGGIGSTGEPDRE